MNKVRLFIVMFLICFVVKSQQYDVHVPWKLEGANERIDTYRKGKAKLLFVLDDQKSESANLNLELANHAFNFGVSMTQEGPFEGTAYQDMYRQRVSEVFNFVTLGFYWGARDEKRGLNDFNKRMDDKISWAVRNKMKIKGHPLLWHESLPKWVINNNDPEELEKIIYKRIKDLILSYPEIKYWDVYNEAVAPFKDHVTPSGVTRWIEYKGGIYPAMLALYDLVNQTDPAKIYTNNHYQPKDPEFFKLNEFFIEQEVGYQAIGMQAHMQTQDNVLEEQELIDLIDSFRSLGKDIQFTEITVTSSKLFKDWKDHQVFLNKRKEAQKKGRKLTLPSLEERENYQAAYIKDLYTLLFSQPSVSSVTMWNLTDRNAWRGHAGGILDQELQPKKAFYTLKTLIKETWTTKIGKDINLNEEFHFTGFYGQYQGTVKVGDQLYKFSFDHRKENEGVIKIILRN
ncbi:MAG: endo-1,4-beta-xylanase [Flavobacteriaceae bacterium]